MIGQLSFYIQDNVCLVIMLPFVASDPFDAHSHLLVERKFIGLVELAGGPQVLPRLLEPLLHKRALRLQLLHLPHDDRDLLIDTCTGVKEGQAQQQERRPVTRRFRNGQRAQKSSKAVTSRMTQSGSAAKNVVDQHRRRAKWLQVSLMRLRPKTESK